MREGARFTLIAVTSLDGRITAGKKEGIEWTSPEDKRWFHKELDRYDALIMGRKTFEAVRRPLTPRNRIVFSRQRISPSKGSTAVFGRRGVLFLNNPTNRKLRNLLQKQSWTRIAVLGGTSIYDWFLKRDLVDDIYLTLEPVIFGSGRPVTSAPLYGLKRFKLISLRRLGGKGTLLLHYKSS